MDLKWFGVVIGPVYVIGVWFGEDQRVNIGKTYIWKRLDYVLKY